MQTALPLQNGNLTPISNSNLTPISNSNLTPISNSNLTPIGNRILIKRLRLAPAYGGAAVKKYEQKE